MADWKPTPEEVELLVSVLTKLDKALDKALAEDDEALTEHQDDPTMEVYPREEELRRADEYEARFGDQSKVHFGGQAWRNRK